MGTFSVPLEIGDPSGQDWHPVDAFVDTGSTYTWVPADVLHQLGVLEEGRRELDTAGGAVIERPIGETRVRLDGESHTTIVVFGQEGTPPLLGAVTLETFGLAVDPVHKRLIPVRALAL
jgi:clan AA aspartic protease